VTLHDIEQCLGMPVSETPRIETERLILRALAISDASAVHAYARHKEVAATTATIPHPYSLEEATAWIGRVIEHVKKGDAFNFGIALRASDEIIGSIDLRVEGSNKAADLGYAIGPAHWNKGYVTEATRAVIAYGFDELGLNRIHAHHFATNGASGRVMEKVGMRCEGTMRERFCKWGEFVDTVHWAILRRDYEAQKLNKE
jgi:RimJ/RimL family protein N-acetyltransferase